MPMKTMFLAAAGAFLARGGVAQAKPILADTPVVRGPYGSTDVRNAAGCSDDQRTSAGPGWGGLNDPSTKQPGTPDRMLGLRR
jgi:hypothetical protein